MRVSGASSIKLADDGALEIESPAGTLHVARPNAFAQSTTGRRAVACRYEIVGPDRVEIVAGEAGPDEILVVDPVVSFSSLIGGSSDDSAVDVKIDGLGRVHVLGVTDSTDFPVVNSLGDLLGTGTDMFVLRMTPEGDAIEQASFLGGTLADTPAALALDDEGNVYVCGSTLSLDFPVEGGERGR